MKKLFFVLMAMCFVPIAQAEIYELSFDTEMYSQYGPKELHRVEINFDSALLTEDTITYKYRYSDGRFNNTWESNYDLNLLAAIQIKINGEIICPHRIRIGMASANTNRGTMGINIYSINKYGFEQHIQFVLYSNDIHVDAYNITDFIFDQFINVSLLIKERYTWSPPCEEDIYVHCTRTARGSASADILPDTLYYGPSTTIHGQKLPPQGHGNRQCH